MVPAGRSTRADTSRIEALRFMSRMACTDVAQTLGRTTAPLPYDVHHILPNPNVEVTKGTFAVCGRQLGS